ncbi:phosphate acyltransferase PlsX [Paraglaciecola hydrolytica]|uniref:Phosphate acyltransferase n=1 Tax=Paraglaciecola hydrolytica TaxID=1799789 RepID=A0A136A2G4_9ALTE|nr:phosphate acyltransferase PlsX [Paraglaciecola hydrolytica]KXI29439.1 phosphate acyltransferase [Paraglaciecola hydrolytica]
MRHLTLALDIMGGDFGPHIILPAALSALTENPDLYVVLCGANTVLEPWLAQQDKHIQNRIILSDCQQTVTMDESPITALRSKKDSSMRRMLDLVEQGQADACVSAGNTGALLAMAYHVLKTLPGIDRPALISQMPTVDGGKVYLLDLGANVDCDSEVLFQYAVMGSVLAELVGNIDRPKVALLNVGSEQNKGNDRVKTTNRILSETASLNYIGYVEGNDIFSQKADVIVTDGFAGNIALKSCEGLTKLVINEVKKASNQNWLNKILAKIALPLLRNIYLRMNPDQYNGASLIGLRGIVVKSHGNASSEAFLYAIREAVKEVNMQVPTKIKDKIEAVLMERH